MNEQDLASEDIEQRFQSLDEKMNQLRQLCFFRSMTRVANEKSRLAKSEHRLIPYLNGLFHVMNNAAYLLDPELGRDTAIELVGLLESDDRARTIQPDLPDADYAATTAWMTACAYDNLATAMGHLKGYNSDGLHACIADGIQVCRRTGKLECIRCFREYATDVHTAADDLDMAMHYARVGMAHEDPRSHDRRWGGAKDLANLLLLTGQIDSAAEAAERAWELAPLWHTPRRAILVTKLILRQVAYLFGEPTRWENLTPAGQTKLDEPPPGEYLAYELFRDQVEAVGACSSGNYVNAIELLSKWDQTLTERHCLHEWCDNRLRLLAAHRLAGNEPELKRLGEPLESKARRNREWRTLRCLARILDLSARAAPVPLVADLAAGPFAATAVQTAVTQGVPTLEAESREQVKEACAAEATPNSQRPVEPPEIVRDFWSRIMAAESVEQPVDADTHSAVFAGILRDLLAIDPGSVSSNDDVCWLLYTARVVSGDCSLGRELWRWAESLAAPRMQDASVLSLLATIGAALRFGPNKQLADLVSEQRLERMFCESLDLDPHSANNFARAGTYFQFTENLGEAERCFARGSRLNRQDARIAIQLADVYIRTDRSREALVVLDMCLREGCETPDVPWKAALTAFGLGQFESTITYLDRYEQLVPNQAWVNYYRAASLLELGRGSEATVAADEELRRNPDCRFPVAIFHAAAAGALGDSAKLRTALASVLDARLSEIDYLSPHGLARLFRRLWLSTECLSEDDPLRRKLEDHMVAANLAPNELFRPLGKLGEVRDDVNLYHCNVAQSLDERWADWPGRLAHESGWQSYVVTWCVLARSEDEAAQIALGWQARAFPGLASILEIRCVEQGYRDACGVIWQGWREEQSQAE